MVIFTVHILTSSIVVFAVNFLLHSCVGKVLGNEIVHIEYVCPGIAIKYLVQSKVVGVDCYF